MHYTLYRFLCLHEHSCHFFSSLKELAQVTDDHDNAEMEDNKPKEESKKEKVQNEMLEDFGEQKFEQVQNETEESDEHRVETDDEEEDENVESDNKGVTTPHMENASTVKYSVKTTPYLQRLDHQLSM